MRLPDGADSYFNVDGAPLNERNPKWLNDDYVKFLRYGQFRVSAVGAGVLGFITNHSYLDNPTFRGMRQSMMTTFPAALLIDLHGNTKKKETSASGQPDENVFDIQQGVAISIWQSPGFKPSGPVMHLDLWGTRHDKYKWLLTHSWSSIGGAKVQPASPTYLLKPRQAEVDSEYASALSLPEIFPVNSLGIATARDHFAVKWSQQEVWDTVKSFAGLTPDQARVQFELGQDARDWKVKLAQADIKDSGPSRQRIQPILYRPFDTRFTYYTGRSRGFHCMPRNEVMRHFLAPGNLGLIGARGLEVAREYDQVFCTRSIIQLHSLSIKEVNYLFPLFLRESEIQGRIGTRDGAGKTVNFSHEFLNRLTKAGLSADPHGAIAVFHYIYAILHSKSYRIRYCDELKTGFPRIPLTRNKSVFTNLANHGADLVALHLLEDDYQYASWNKKEPVGTSPLAKALVRVAGPGSARVEAGFPKLEGARVLINERKWIELVAEDVWTFTVGGYQVCEKWLKDRRGRQLTNEEVATYCKIVAAVRETIRIMKRIDQAIEAAGGWPIS
jgi:predicted helicase